MFYHLESRILLFPKNACSSGSSKKKKAKIKIFQLCCKYPDANSERKSSEQKKRKRLQRHLHYFSIVPLPAKVKVCWMQNSVYTAYVFVPFAPHQLARDSSKEYKANIRPSAANCECSVYSSSFQFKILHKHTQTFHSKAASERAGGKTRHQPQKTQVLRRQQQQQKQQQLRHFILGMLKRVAGEVRAHAALRPATHRSITEWWHNIVALPLHVSVPFAASSI